MKGARVGSCWKWKTWKHRESRRMYHPRDKCGDVGSVARSLRVS